MPEEEALAFLREMADVSGPVAGQWIQLGIVLRQTDVLIGDVGLLLDQDAETAEIGFSLARQYQGQGLATEAIAVVVQAVFANTAVMKLRGVTDTRNIASIRLLERTGFVKMSEQQSVVRGEACGEYVFERTRHNVASG